MLGRVATVGASSSSRMNAAALSRLRSAATSSERRHQFSTLQAIPQHFLLHQQPHVATGLPSRDDDDDDAQNKSHRSNIMRHSSAKINWNNNNTAAPATMMQHNTNNNNLTVLRQYHTTLPEQRGVAVVLTLGAVAATAKAGQYAVQGYNEYKEAMEEERKRQELEEKNNPKPKEEATHTAQDDATNESTTDNSQSSQSSTAGGKAKGGQAKRENFFAKFFNLSVGAKYYEGGFEEQMTRKEAALILGVRESSTAKRIKEAHRKLLILNHPDTGGSTYVAGKINEAKELLLKGKK
mmetsp:Transcript_7370/g.11231  ORF Transcript_7370/g.11231 Transcript_7370/m.11231 type:complete len:295 (+) Transcript_7370:59-943(+)